MPLALLCVASAVWSPSAAAEPGTGPHGSVDQTFTTTRPSSPTGVNFSATFHAAGDEQGKPPFLRQMVIHPPEGMSYDTSVPDRCTASDAELALRGPAACSPESRLGDGTSEGDLLVPSNDDFIFHEFVHPLHVLNNADEQIVLVESEGYTVVRGRFRSDGAQEWRLPTCFPNVSGTDCADEHVRQLSTETVLPPYTEGADSYATTPPRCPRAGHWRTRVELTWSDGSFDDIVTTQPCSKK